MSYSFFLTVLCMSRLLAVWTDEKIYTRVGQLFVYELKRETFQRDFQSSQHYEPSYDDPMVFKCNKQYSPDLPRWLRYTQRHQKDSGFLYGSPLLEDTGKTVIEITILNKRSYETLRERLVITVGVPEKTMPYQAEFYLALREIEKVLPSSVQEEIKQDIRRMWGTERLQFVNITSTLDRGGRVPLPLAGHYEGVYVKLSSNAYFSKCLLRLQTAEHHQQCQALGKDAGDCSVCADPSNCISWCNSTLIDVSNAVPPPAATTPGSGIVEGGGFYDPPEFVPIHNYFPEYLYTVILPLVLAIILCITLAYIMCFRREGLEKRNARTPNIQLYHHQTILENTDELRNMARCRDGPHPLSTLPMFNAHTGERMPPQQSPYISDSAHIPLIMAQHPEPTTDPIPRLMSGK